MAQWLRLCPLTAGGRFHPWSGPTRASWLAYALSHRETYGGPFSVNVGFLSEAATVGKTAGQENGSRGERWEGGSRQTDMSLPRADSLCCVVETKTTWQSNYPSIKNSKF